MLRREKALWSSSIVVVALSLASISHAGSGKQGEGKNGLPASRVEQNSSDEKGKAHPTAEPDETVDQGQYVGSEFCKTCHEDVAKTYDNRPLAMQQHRGGLPRA